MSTTFEAIWQDHCDSISRADFWALLGKIVVERADPTNSISIAYQFGRKDNAQCDAGANRLPNAQLGEDMFQQVFVNQMGLTLNDAGNYIPHPIYRVRRFTFLFVHATVTLLGAHTLGHVHTDVSGYGVPVGRNARPDDNAWDSSPASFDNRYYQNLINLPVWNTAFPNGNDKNLWTRRGNNQIMLNSDMALGFDIAIDAQGLASQTQRCGSQGAPGGAYGCARPTATTVPSTGALARTYANDNAAFLRGFAESYVKMASVGYGIAGQTTAGKLGTLIAFDPSLC